MKPQRELLEKQKAEYEENARRLKAYVGELTDMALKHGTDSALLEEDLTKAKDDLQYYEFELEEIKGLIEKEHDGAAYLVFKDSSGEWRWHLRASNDRIIADSGEGYRNKQDCLHGIELVKASKGVPVKDKE